jgi:glycosyltransferase involved in cell wall biosynthesis
MNKRKVLVVATSSKTKGGITSVINSYKNTKLWWNWNCIWIETHVDKFLVTKILFFIKSILMFLVLIPNASIVHIHLSGPTSTKRKQIFISLSKFFKKKIIIHFHAFSEKSSIDVNFKKLYFKTFNSADKIIVLSKSWKEGLINDLSICKNRIKVIYNPCLSRPQTTSKNKKNYILYAGTLNERKNYKNLLKAFAQISKEFLDWKLVFAGNGELNEAKKLGKKLNIQSQVEFKGWVFGSEKEKLFQESRIFCLPSYAEGFPMAVLDAWSYGLPVITTPVGGIPDVAIDNENVILFNPNDISELAFKIKKLILDINLQEKLSKASLSFAENEFSLQNIISNVEQSYLELSQ